MRRKLILGYPRIEFNRLLAEHDSLPNRKPQKPETRRARILIRRKRDQIFRICGKMKSMLYCPASDQHARRRNDYDRPLSLHNRLSLATSFHKTLFDRIRNSPKSSVDFSGLACGSVNKNIKELRDPMLLEYGV